MSYVAVAPDLMASAAADLQSIGAALDAAHAAALGPTTKLLAAGADEVSGAVAALFGGYGEAYHSVTAQVGAFHQQFVGALNGGAASYALTEAASANPLQTLEQDVLGVVNAPTQTLLGRPLIGDGTNGGPGQAGGPGGLLFGNGGAGGNGVTGQAGGNAFLFGDGGAGGQGGTGLTGANGVNPTISGQAATGADGPGVIANNANVTASNGSVGTDGGPGATGMSGQDG